MLASFVVSVKSYGGMPPLANTGPLLHAAFLAAIGKVDRHLAAQLHGGGNTKPFTLSSLQQYPSWGRKLSSSDSSGVFWFRITTLTKPLYLSVDQMLHEQLSTAAATFGESKLQLQVIGVRSGPVGGLSWSGISTFEEMYDQSAPGEQITLQFHSPTSFKRKGKSVPLPLPDLVFASYLQKWNAYSPFKFDRISLLTWVGDSVAIEAHQIETVMVPFGKFQIVGFVGTCRYRVLKKDTEKQRILNALADFAFYAGTGAKTTMGMGQTRRLK